MYNSTETNRCNSSLDLANSIQVATQAVMQYDDLSDAYDVAFSTLADIYPAIQEIQDLLGDLEEAVEKFRPLFGGELL
ncbi:MAG: hypothetical protein IJ708_10345 [Clostridia bacterium]|nr:hypothetical protein [Clostridia bacterium]